MLCWAVRDSISDKTALQQRSKGRGRQAGRSFIQQNFIEQLLCHPQPEALDIGTEIEQTKGFSDRAQREEKQCLGAARGQDLGHSPRGARG
jgi:hypothetical protein